MNAIYIIQMLTIDNNDLYNDTFSFMLKIEETTKQSRFFSLKSKTTIDQTLITIRYLSLKNTILRPIE